jgi:membrane protease YdiL (CAAX protease family)
VVAEELYFRGQLYSFIEKRLSAPAALVVTALLFGILHARQGLRSIITKTITGALWGFTKIV